jgi:hypothetical protein
MWPHCGVAQVWHRPHSGTGLKPPQGEDCGRAGLKPLALAAGLKPLALAARACTPQQCQQRCPTRCQRCGTAWSVPVLVCSSAQVAGQDGHVVLPVAGTAVVALQAAGSGPVVVGTVVQAAGSGPVVVGPVVPGAVQGLCKRIRQRQAASGGIRWHQVASGSIRQHQAASGRRGRAAHVRCTADDSACLLHAELPPAMLPLRPPPCSTVWLMAA